MTPGGESPVALVTGAGRGLGLGIVRALLADGWLVCAVDVGPDLGAALDALEEPERAVAVPADVTDPQACEQAVAVAVDRFGRLDALVNNAGIGGPATAVHDTDPAEFAAVLSVNLVGPFLMARAAVPRILEGGRGGAVVMIGSVLGARGEAGGGAYCATKAGVALLGQCMALELAPAGIRVNTVAPGNMMTAMHEEYLAELARQTGRSFDEAVTAVRETVPLGRHGTPDDIGDVVAWLLSPQASYVTGQTIHVNGGILLT